MRRDIPSPPAGEGWVRGKMSLKKNFSSIHYSKEAKGVFFHLLKILSLFYGFGSSLKNALYGKKILKPKKVDAFVVSVGNLTTGGVGKTPVVSQVANYYTQKGEKVAIISRGYGGKLSNKNINIISDGKEIFFGAESAGDEPVWLAENAIGACVITSKNRFEASKYAIEKFGVTKIVLDDGFQHRKLHRDLDIVLIDSEMGFGNENLLPAGPLREGLEAFDRIDKLVIVSKNMDHTRAEKYAKIMGKKLKKQAVVCYTEPDFIYNIKNPEQKLESGVKVLAFSAIGQPKQFYKFLSDYDVLDTIDFDDHHNYVQTDIDKLALSEVKTFITTEKDAVKLAKLDLKDLNIYALKLKTKFDAETLLNEN